MASNKFESGFFCDPEAFPAYEPLCSACIDHEAVFADKILLLPAKKSVLFGSPSDIMNTDNLKYTFGVDFECKEIKSFQSLQ